jgi:hypothetical protein
MTPNDVGMFALGFLEVSLVAFMLIIVALCVISFVPRWRRHMDDWMP